VVVLHDVESEVAFNAPVSQLSVTPMAVDEQQEQAATVVVVADSPASPVAAELKEVTEVVKEVVVEHKQASVSEVMDVDVPMSHLTASTLTQACRPWWETSSAEHFIYSATPAGFLDGVCDEVEVDYDDNVSEGENEEAYNIRRAQEEAVDELEKKAADELRCEQEKVGQKRACWGKWSIALNHANKRASRKEEDLEEGEVMTTDDGDSE
jgi:hypothetical protein